MGNVSLKSRNNSSRLAPALAGKGRERSDLVLFPLIKISNMITADLATIIDRLEVEFVKLPCRVLNYWLQLVFNSFSYSSAVPSSFSFCTGSCIHPPSALHLYTPSAYSTVDPNSLLLYSTQLCPQSFLSVSFCGRPKYLPRYCIPLPIICTKTPDYYPLH